MAVGRAVRPGRPGAEQIVLNAFQGDRCIITAVGTAAANAIHPICTLWSHRRRGRG